jgi:hypothetical protein
MKLISTILICLTVAFGNCGRTTEDRPKTVAQAVDILMAEMDAESLEWLKFTPRAEVVSTFHFTLGMAVRNQFQLWGGNEELLESCGDRKMHPDEASSVILEALWSRLHADLAPAKAANCERLYQLAKGSQIDVQSLQRQTMEQVAARLEAALKEAGPGNGLPPAVTLGSGIDRNLRVVVVDEALESMPAPPA